MVFFFVLVHFLIFIFIFYTLCIVCDEHLVVAVEIIIEQFQVPEEVAGDKNNNFDTHLNLHLYVIVAVTLVAFGSAAPELFLNSVSAIYKTSDLSLSAILGSGMIAFGLIPPLCMLNSNKFEMKLKIYPILREVLWLSFNNLCSYIYQSLQQS